MRTFDWFFYREDETRRTELVHITPSSTDSTATEHRFIFGEELTSRTKQSNLVFRAVRGDLTCADQALRTPEDFPLPQIKAFLKTRNRPVAHKSELFPNTDWRAFRKQTAMMDPSDKFAVREAMIEVLGAQPDYRIGLASLVVNRGGFGTDILTTNTTRPENSAERIVGELLEIASLNILYKRCSNDTLVDAARSLLSFVTDPTEIRRTWSAHLFRTLEFNSNQWRTQANAIDLAEDILSDLWSQSRDLSIRVKTTRESSAL